MTTSLQSARVLSRAAFGLLLVVFLAGCTADKAYTPTVTTAPTQPAALATKPAAAPTERPVYTPTTAVKTAAAITTPTVAAKSPTVAPAATSGSATNAVSVVLTDYRVSVFQTAYDLGKTYTFTISNNGAVAHSFVIEAEGAVNQPLTNSGKAAVIDSIDPGQSATLEWTFTVAGTVQIASHLNDDYTQGMVKTGLTVK